MEFRIPITFREDPGMLTSPWALGRDPQRIQAGRTSGAARSIVAPAASTLWLRSKNLPVCPQLLTPCLGTQRCSSPIQCVSFHPVYGYGTVIPCLKQPVKFILSLRPWRRARNLLLVSSPKTTLPAPAPHPFWVTFLLPKISLCSSRAAERDTCPRESTPLPSLAPHTGNMDSRA